MNIIASFEIVLKGNQRLKIGGHKVNVQADLLELDVFFGDYHVMSIDVDDVLCFDIVKEDVRVKVLLNEIQGSWKRFDLEDLFYLGEGKHDEKRNFEKRYEFNDNGRLFRSRRIQRNTFNCFL